MKNNKQFNVVPLPSRILILLLLINHVDQLKNKLLVFLFSKGSRGGETSYKNIIQLI